MKIVKVILTCSIMLCFCVTFVYAAQGGKAAGGQGISSMEKSQKGMNKPPDLPDQAKAWHTPTSSRGYGKRNHYYNMQQKELRFNRLFL